MFLSRGAETDVHYTTKSHTTQRTGSSLWFLPKPDSWVALITGLQGYQKNKAFVITNSCSQPDFFLVIFFLLLLREQSTATQPASTESATHVPYLQTDTTHSPQQLLCPPKFWGDHFLQPLAQCGIGSSPPPTRPCVGKVVINNGWMDGFFSSWTVMTCQMI